MSRSRKKGCLAEVGKKEEIDNRTNDGKNGRRKDGKDGKCKNERKWEKGRKRNEIKKKRRKGML